MNESDSCWPIFKEAKHNRPMFLIRVGKYQVTASVMYLSKLKDSNFKNRYVHDNVIPVYLELYVGQVS